MKIRMLSDGSDWLGVWAAGEIIERPDEHCVRLIRLGDAEQVEPGLLPTLPADG